MAWFAPGSPRPGLGETRNPSEVPDHDAEGDFRRA